MIKLLKKVDAGIVVDYTGISYKGGNDLHSSLFNEKLKVVTTTKGAELLSVICNGREYMWQGSTEYWEYHAPVLFPYVGRLTENKYQYKGHSFQMMIHGFAMDSEFSIIQESDDHITYELRDNPKLFEVFPFAYSLRISYTLISSEIKVDYVVENLSNELIHFGIGAHPGFNVPLEDGLEFEDYYIQFSHGCKPDRISFSDNVLLGRTREPYALENSCINLKHNLFDNDAIVLENMGTCVSLESKKSSRKIKLTFPSMPYLGIWHANKTKAPYICIEPWASLPSREGVIEDISCKSDLIHLVKGGTYINTWSMEFT